MITDNLSSLFAAGAPGVRFRQGTILSWDSNTGQNTVDLAGGTLTNVPILNTGEAVALRAGHIVGLLGQGASWFIVGRVTPPNDPNFAGASVAFGGVGVSATNFAVTTSVAVKAAGSIVVPSWADEAVVLATANASVNNSSASSFYLTLQAFIDGIGGGGAQFGLDTSTGLNSIATASVSAQRVLTPGATIPVDVRIATTSGTVPANSLSIANIDAIAIFRSIT